MERRKAKSLPATSFPEEADPFHAKEALRDGDERGVGYFARDHAEVLSLLADLFDPPEGTARKLRFVSHHRRRPKPNEAASHDEDSDWEGALVEVKAAIETGSAASIGWYLRDAADVYRRVGDALDPPSGSRGRRLKFVGTGPGRRADPSKMIADSRIRQTVAFAKRGKLEAVVAEAAEKLGASVFRALQRRPESQKKR